MCCVGCKLISNGFAGADESSKTELKSDTERNPSDTQPPKNETPKQTNTSTKAILSDATNLKCSLATTYSNVENQTNEGDREEEGGIRTQGGAAPKNTSVNQIDKNTEGNQSLLENCSGPCSISTPLRAHVPLQNGLSEVADSSITETQMAAIFEEDFQIDNGPFREPCGTPTGKPVASTPVAREDKQISSLFPTSLCDRKSLNQTISPSLTNLSNLSGDMFEAPSSGAGKKKIPVVNWSTESAFHCSPLLHRSNDDVSTESSRNLPFSNYLRLNQEDVEESVQSMEKELYKASLSNSTCLNEINLDESDEFRVTDGGDTVSSFEDHAFYSTCDVPFLHYIILHLTFLHYI